MPDKNWSKLNNNQLGKYAEYYCKMEFTSYGYDVYTSEVDDHGVDFVVKDPNGNFYEIQVKSFRKNNYTFIRKDKIVLDDNHLVCLVHFIDNKMPEMYVLPSTVWNKPNDLFVSRDYGKPGQKSKPEWGINYSEKNKHLLEKYKTEKVLNDILLLRKE